ncbi:hypothetical protein B0H67DRAFT_580086 [Lasiosphaeris hirsuta]|uniref:Uncharacterized protein n=1 Tax=Lasiosphaeris hirsuta TaxID=260670 RepID=A0AA40DVM2_9PEZI|nr:hypothetical protein B0H67DRAFT_580086 [Lasiosphaeris hirsuta]
MFNPSRQPTVAAEPEFQRGDAELFVFAYECPRPRPCEFLSISMHWPGELLVVGQTPVEVEMAILETFGPIAIAPRRSPFFLRLKYTRRMQLGGRGNTDSAMLKLLDILEDSGFAVYASTESWPLSIIFQRPAHVAGPESSSQESLASRD